MYFDSQQQSGYGGRERRNLAPNGAQFLRQSFDSQALESNPLWISNLAETAWRQKWIVLALLGAGTVIGYYATRMQEPVYQARTSIEVQNINDNFLSFRDLNPTSAGGGYDSDIQTQAKILRSQTLVKRVVARLSQPDPQRSGVYTRDALASTAENYKVVISDRTRIVDIITDSPDPRLAADFANVLAEEFMRLGLEGRSRSSQSTTEWLGRQLQDLKARMESSEQQLQSYAGSSQLIITGDKGNIEEEKLRQIQQDLSKTQSELVARQSRRDLALTSPAETLPDVLDSGSLGEYKSKLADLRRQLADMTSQFTPAYYKVQRLQAQIANVEAAEAKERDGVLARINNEYEDAVRRESLFRQAYQNQVRQVSVQAEKAIHYDLLKHEVDTNRQLYEVTLQKIKEATLASALHASNISVVDPAEIPAQPYKPVPVYNAAVGAFGGLALGLCFAQVRRRSIRRIQDPGEVTGLLDVPELGTIVSAQRERGIERPWLLPAAGRSGRPSGGILDLTETSNRQLPVPAPDNPPSLLAESVRTAVTSILLSHSRSRVIVFASPEPRDGKSTVVSNLATMFAALNQRVLLIDADLRKPTLHDIFNIPSNPGLMDLIREEPENTPEPAGPVPVKTKSGVYVLPAGTGTFDVAALYRRPMAELLRRFRRDFDLILVDTPAMLHIPDARMLARLADGVILVIRSNFTDRDAARTVRERFSQDGTPVLGAILNDWNPKSSGYGFYNPAKFYKYYRRAN